MKKYISGWEALNIPNEKNMIADWHPPTLSKTKSRYQNVSLQSYFERRGDF